MKREHVPLVSALLQTEVFGGLPVDGLRRLAEQGEARQFAEGSPIMRQGDTSEALHVILRGSVRVERRDSVADESLILAEFFPGDVVGEMGVLDGARRSATVTALEPTETLALTAPLLSVTLADYPSASAALIRTLSRRIRRTGELTERLARGEHASGAAADDGEARRGLALQTVSADFLDNLKAAIRAE